MKILNSDSKALCSQLFGKGLINKRRLPNFLRSDEGGDRGVSEFLTGFGKSSVAAAVDKSLTLERFFSYVPFNAQYQ